MNNKEKINFLIKISISIVLVIAIITVIGMEKIQETLPKIKIEFFALIAVFFIASMFLTTLAIMPLTGIKKTYKLFKFKTISWSTGLFLPSKMGEMSFPLLLKKEGIPAKKAIIIFFIDRFISFSILGVLGIIGAIKYLDFKIELIHLLGLAGILILISITKNRIKKIKKIEKITVFLSETKNYLKQEKKAILINYFFSCINFIIMFLTIKLLFLGLGENISLIDIALVSALSLLIGLLPFTISGIGLREGTQVYFYSIIGVNPEISALAAFIFLVASYSLAGICLAFFGNEFSFILKRKSENPNA